MENNKQYLEIVNHYEDCLAKHGDTHLGVDWPNLQDVLIRYQVMLDVIREGKSSTISLLDFGCGTSQLYDYIQKNFFSQIIYYGLDISPKYIEVAQNKYPHLQFYCLDVLIDDSKMPESDYVVMNGVFTEKRGLTFEAMWHYFQQLILKVFSKAHRGIAFNVMSKQVDWEREDLFHLSMDLLASFLKKNISRHFVFRHEYGLYEYTVYVYKSPR
ncbi:class I SAM-dependent methyltransferase [Adhaeribacter pallidiroseus]|uniref:Methyltransferase type 12 domain-containing protein n=1 Tax=Adhaeribacter pallidiroseus TaxID=2072847 RepID=A0A369QMF4_9BACT|nr:class I SAM-dependent methyltransferase [Adhaeribacter pallidiroseus]RDC66111.1 hypothetical protein AHMF7616_04742 [Adhaeribacter pallidiroseus]